MNVIMAFIMREINLVWSKIMRKEISEDTDNQKKWILFSIVATLLIVLPIFIVYFIFN